ncbi:hypothetical protein BC832DRAFT_461007 [Gaertneriomyces semiglobifer]|nr:hypothetical protein BC832DRAFT_461007 [Gaertneriomyces semiglobifer]
MHPGRRTDLSKSIMAAEADRNSLVVNPWDAGGGSGVSYDELPSIPATAPIVTSELAFTMPPSDIDTSPVFTTQASTLSLSPEIDYQLHHQPSMDYISPTEAARAVTPEPDPWTATVPKLDAVFKTSTGQARKSKNADNPPGTESTESRTDDIMKVPEPVPTPNVDFLNLDRIKVSVSPERGGLVFKHVNYLVQSHQRKTNVLRRYSDFLWLSDLLVKRYPLRLIPNLPPKKVGADDTFLERRRCALARFINLVANHPILREEEAVIAFLTVEMDIQSFRRKAHISEEESETALSDLDITAIPTDIDERVEQMRGQLDFLIVQFRDLAVLADRCARREDAMAMDTMRYSLILDKLTENPSCPTSCIHCPRLMHGFTQISGGLQRISRIMESEVESTFAGLIEQLKTQRDMFMAFAELLGRANRAMQILGVDALQKRIKTQEERVNEMKQSGKDSERAEFALATVSPRPPLVPIDGLALRPAFTGPERVRSTTEARLVYQMVFMAGASIPASAESSCEFDVSRVY